MFLGSLETPDGAEGDRILTVRDQDGDKALASWSVQFDTGTAP